MVLYAGSLPPPAVPVPASTSGHPSWVLLNTLGYVADRDNATRAEALTNTGQPIAFTFFPAEPPAISHFCVHCRGLGNAGYATEPQVAYCVDNLFLLTICLKFGRHVRDLHREYFLYRASRRGKPQSLEPLPGLFDQLKKIETFAPVAILPCGGGGDHFVLASLGRRDWTGDYDFCVFRSELGTWTEKVVKLGRTNAMDPTKVILLGGGEVGYVDLLRGVLVCNVLDNDPVFRVIPLPTLLPANRVYTGNGAPPNPDRFRDVVCVDGVITLVEVERCRRRVVHDPSKLEVLYDEDLPFGVAAFIEPEETYEYTGWRLLTWNRTVSSNCWRRGRLVHVDDLVVDDIMRHSALLPPAGLVDLLPVHPTLSMDDTDVVYLKCKVGPKDKKSWFVAVDMRKKTIQDVAPFPDERTRNRNYITSALF